MSTRERCVTRNRVRRESHEGEGATINAEKNKRRSIKRSGKTGGSAAVRVVREQQSEERCGRVRRARRQTDDTWGSAPYEVLQMILVLLDDASLVRSGRVCKRWREISMQDALWERHCRARWKLIDIRAYNNAWRDVFFSRNSETKWQLIEKTTKALQMGCGCSARSIEVPPSPASRLIFYAEANVVTITAAHFHNHVAFVRVVDKDGQPIVTAYLSGSATDDPIGELPLSSLSALTDNRVEIAVVPSAERREDLLQKMGMAVALKDYARAERIATEAMVFEPYPVHLLMARCTARLKQNKLEQGVEDLDTALSFGPNSTLLVYRCQLNFQLREYSEAIRDAGQLIGRFPLPEFASIAYNNSGLALTAMGDAERGLGLIRKAGGDASEALDSEAVALIHLGRHREAVRKLLEMRELGSLHEHNYELPVCSCVHLFDAYEALGQWEEALDAIQGAMRKDYAAAFARRGKALWMLGRRQRGRADVAKAIQLRNSGKDRQIIIDEHEDALDLTKEMQQYIALLDEMDREIAVENGKT